MQTLILPPRLFPTVDYYKAIVQSGSPSWGIALRGRFDKRQKSAHRYTIADTQGTLDLTVPIAKTALHTPWAKVDISTHGGWWDVHRVTLESAYGRTPFFEFYIDRLLPLLQSPQNPGACRTLGELLVRSNTIIAPILAIEPPTDNQAQVPTIALPERHHRQQPGPEAIEHIREETLLDQESQIKPYYQVRQQKFGFIPGLSILDLIFNLGPESALYLRDML